MNYELVKLELVGVHPWVHHTQTHKLT